MEEQEPALINSKGEYNQQEWTTWYTAKRDISATNAHREFLVRIGNMSEPTLTVGKDKVNLIWVRWYCVRKRCSTNIARNVCKLRIKALADGKVIKEHQPVWW